MAEEIESPELQEQGAARPAVDERNVEAPLSFLSLPRTPTEHTFLRTHIGVPPLRPEELRLEIGGHVETPLTLSLTDLQRRTPRTVAMTLECAGNGRTLFKRPVEGLRWGVGAVSHVAFTGVPLMKVLEAARVQPGTVELVFFGADADGEGPFARSLPLADALREDVLLAWAMNGEPLTHAHGAPLRLVVPGWYGVAAVKWLTRIEAWTKPFDGRFQVEQYVYDDGAGRKTPVTRVKPRALIATPSNNAEVKLGPVEIRGTAWSGEAPVLRVAISADGGRNWYDAELGRAESKYSAAPFRMVWTPPGEGEFELMARVFDRNGNTQPLEPIWNRLGYGNNAVQRVKVRVVP